MRGLLDASLIAGGLLLYLVGSIADSSMVRAKHSWVPLSVRSSDLSRAITIMRLRGEIYDSVVVRKRVVSGGPVGIGPFGALEMEMIAENGRYIERWGSDQPQELQALLIRTLKTTDCHPWQTHHHLCRRRQKQTYAPIFSYLYRRLPAAERLAPKEFRKYERLVSVLCGSEFLLILAAVTTFSSFGRVSSWLGLLAFALLAIVSGAAFISLAYVTVRTDAHADKVSEHAIRVISTNLARPEVRVALKGLAITVLLSGIAVWCYSA